MGQVKGEKWRDSKMKRLKRASRPRVERRWKTKEDPGGERGRPMQYAQGLGGVFENRSRIFYKCVPFFARGYEGQEGNTLDLRERE